MTTDNELPEELSEDERKAVTSLKRLAKSWPDTLWLFSASGSLCVMKKDGDGEKVHTTDGGFDSTYLVDQIDIPNDGGDW